MTCSRFGGFARAPDLVERARRLAARGRSEARVTPRRSRAPAPQSKPVTPASRLVARVEPLVAFGLGPRILAAGPARIRLARFAGGYVNQSSIVCSAHPRARASVDSSPADSSSLTELARAGIIDRSRDPETARSIGIPAHCYRALSRPGAGLGRREPRNRHPACPAARSSNSIRSMSAPSRSSPTSHAA